MNGYEMQILVSGFALGGQTAMAVYAFISWRAAAQAERDSRRARRTSGADQYRLSLALYQLQHRAKGQPVATQRRWSA
ncbi:hypothetical protein [Streptomyces sp. NPDC018031]|uniref:hypothetical protein n=1 Tax=Streptomyces sp. NPDC018031 TaxID=3365033 RepID=UPI0037B35ADA